MPKNASPSVTRHQPSQGDDSTATVRPDPKPRANHELPLEHPMKFLPTLHIVVRPVGRGRYAALLDGQEICRSETPFFSAARQLLSQGYAPSRLLTMRHDRSAAVAIRSTIGRAAGLTVDEPPKGGIRIVRLRNTVADGVFTELPDPRPQTAKVPTAGTWVAEDLKSALEARHRGCV
jgi:hypothetical protein